MPTRSRSITSASAVRQRSTPRYGATTRRALVGRRKICSSASGCDGNTPLTLPAAPSLALAANAALTWSAWIKPAALQPNAELYSRRSGADALVIGLDNGVPFVEVSNAGSAQRSGTGVPIAPNSWHHLAVVANGGQVTLYLDGNPYSTLAAALPALNAIATIGGDTSAAAPDAPATPSAAPDAAAAAPATTTPPPDTTTPADAATPTAAPAAVPEAAPAAAAAGFVGDIDELEIAKVARPAGFIKFAAIGQGTDPSKLISFSVDEETASWLSGYLAVILKSVTLDGWVVIGVLLIMAVISWVVMIDKAAFLNKQAKANNQFMRRFRELAADLTTLDYGDAESAATLGGRVGAADVRTMQASSLYRIYHVGAAEISHRFTGNGKRMAILSAPTIAAIRAALDSSVVKEMQRLNRLMVVLTIAISGGPFLGLLGTVVGVMITFAAIAASGDVNVNAIAPGIAAALATKTDWRNDRPPRD